MEGTGGCGRKEKGKHRCGKRDREREGRVKSFTKHNYLITKLMHFNKLKYTYCLSELKICIYIANNKCSTTHNDMLQTQGRGGEVTQHYTITK